MKRRRASLAQLIAHTNVDVTERFTPAISRSLKMAGASGIANIMVGLGKLVMGILSLSFFTCVSAFYTFGMVVAKYFALSGILKARNRGEQYRYYTLSGIILTVASLLYIAYSVRLFLHPTIAVYHMYVALAIASFTFAELAINLRGVIRERRNHTPLFHAIKMINLASSLICLVLTQTAILSFTNPQMEISASANGLIGIFMGACATMLGIVMIVHIRRIQSGKNYGPTYRKVKRFMKKAAFCYQIKPVRLTENHAGCPALQVELPSNISKEIFQALQAEVKQQLKLELIDERDNESGQEEGL
ncbi:MAG TPA: hypothetical protein VN441_02340 [Syntrophomonas sp.]|nr:hypothetical protein [Syntrophomonas sp.]